MRACELLAGYYELSPESLLRDTNCVEHERVAESSLSQHVVAARRSTVSARHVDLDVERIVVGFHRAEFGDPLHRLPVADLGIVERRRDQHPRVSFALDVIVRRI